MLIMSILKLKKVNNQRLEIIQMQLQLEIEGFNGCNDYKWKSNEEIFQFSEFIILCRNNSVCYLAYIGNVLALNHKSQLPRPYKINC